MKKEDIKVGMCIVHVTGILEITKLNSKWDNAPSDYTVQVRFLKINTFGKLRNSAWKYGQYGRYYEIDYDQITDIEILTDKVKIEQLKIELIAESL